MYRRRRTSWKKAVALSFVIVSLLAFAYTKVPHPPRAHRWDRWDRPEDAGYSSEGIQRVRTYVGTLGTTGLLVVVDGKVLLSEGAVEALGYLAAGRFSIMAVVFGRPVADGTIDLSTTLEDLQVEDRGGLLPKEKTATIQDLLTNRSGVYHPTAYGDGPVGTPPRGTDEPGSRFFYHPWGGFALRGIFEFCTDRSLFRAMGEDLAAPLGLQDFRWWRQNRGHDVNRSVFTAFNLYVSTRDIARFGQLMLQGGEWEGRQLVPRKWVDRMTTMVTPPTEVAPAEYQALGLGFGLQWWVWPDTEGPYVGAYTYIGAFGQYLTVLPALHMVVAHQVYAGWSGPPERTVSWSEYSRLLEKLVQARLAPPDDTAVGSRRPDDTPSPRTRSAYR